MFVGFESMMKDEGAQKGVKKVKVLEGIEMNLWIYSPESNKNKIKL